MTVAGSGDSLSIVILAAGAGERMKSDLPKPLHPVAGRPMLAHVLDVARTLDPVDITLVCSNGLRAGLGDASWATDVHFAIQEVPRGTGDAVRVAVDTGLTGERVLVLYADHPLVTPESLQGLIDEFEAAHANVGVMSCTVPDAAGYGRIARDDAGNVTGVVEKSDDDASLRTGSTEINSGVMVLEQRWAARALHQLQPHKPRNEYFLTDLVAMANESRSGSAIAVSGPEETLVGVNTRLELSVADGRLRERKRVALMLDGVTIIAPETNLIDGDVAIGRDTTIGPNCVVEEGTSIGTHCRIGPNAVLRASRIGDRVRIESSTIENSSIGADSDVGPYAHLRAGCEIGQRVHIGNYAELKNAQVADDVRIGHFSYVGDASLGPDVNVGAGTVTCNYDGTAKHRTEIGAGAFIGSDTLLVAPVSIGAGARTGAGSVVTRDVEAGTTVVGMPARRIRRRTVDSDES